MDVHNSLCKSGISVVSYKCPVPQNEPILWTHAESGHFSARQIQELYDAFIDKTHKLSMVL